MNRFSLCSVGMAAILLGGCQTTKVGPNALRSSQGAYSQAIAANLDEQLLQNIVRLRYRDNPIFLDVGDVSQTNKLGGSLGISDIPLNHLSNTTGTLKPSFNGDVSATIKYGQLKGKEFVHTLVTVKNRTRRESRTRLVHRCQYN